jgi:hypothetical protein
LDLSTRDLEIIDAAVAFESGKRGWLGKDVAKAQYKDGSGPRGLMFKFVLVGHHP